MDAALAHDLDLAKMKPEAPLQLGVKLRIGQRNQAPRFLRFLGPHDGRAPSGERKNRKRSGGQEMLLGATAVIARVRHCGDDCALTVWPAVHGDSCALADRRARAIRSHEQRCRQRLTVLHLDIDMPGRRGA